MGRKAYREDLEGSAPSFSLWLNKRTDIKRHGRNQCGYARIGETAA